MMVGSRVDRSSNFKSKGFSWMITANFSTYVRKWVNDANPDSCSIMEQELTLYMETPLKEHRMANLLLTLLQDSITHTGRRWHQCKQNIWACRSWLAMGVVNNVSYKSISLRFQFDGVVGGVLEDYVDIKHFREAGILKPQACFGLPDLRMKQMCRLHRRWCEPDRCTYSVRSVSGVITITKIWRWHKTQPRAWCSHLFIIWPLFLIWTWLRKLMLSWEKLRSLITFLRAFLANMRLYKKQPSLLLAEIYFTSSPTGIRISTWISTLNPVDRAANTYNEKFRFNLNFTF